jgi:hypothetical protein
VRRQFGRPAHFLPPGDGPRPAFAGAGPDQIARRTFRCGSATRRRFSRRRLLVACRGRDAER